MKKVIYPVLMTICVLSVVFSLILCGKTMYDSGDFWIKHGNIILSYRMVILIPLLMITSYFIKKIRKYRYKKISVITTTCVLYIISLIFVFFIRENPHYKEVYYNDKKAKYMCEKILRFYYLRNEVPILPYNEAKMYNITNEENETNCYKYHNLTTSYYPRIYKDTISVKLGYCVSENAEEQFYDKGGKFSDKELSELKFYKLFDDNFVLNK